MLERLCKFKVSWPYHLPLRGCCKVCHICFRVIPEGSRRWTVWFPFRKFEVYDVCDCCREKIGRL